MKAAIDAFNQALSVRQKEVSPLDWAGTMRNRALAQKKLGEMLDDTQWYDRAIADYQAALTGFTRDASPVTRPVSRRAVASAQANRGRFSWK